MDQQLVQRNDMHVSQILYHEVGPVSSGLPEASACKCCELASRLAKLEALLCSRSARAFRRGSATTFRPSFDNVMKCLEGVAHAQTVLPALHQAACNI